MHVGKNSRRMDAILDLGKFLEVCETRFEIFDFKVYAYMRRPKYNNAIEIANNRANQLHTIISSS